jgi:hypothetical protein
MFSNKLKLQEGKNGNPFCLSLAKRLEQKARPGWHAQKSKNQKNIKLLVIESISRFLIYPTRNLK